MVGLPGSIGPARSMRCAWSTSGAGSWRGAGIGTTSRGSGRCARLVGLQVVLVALERPDGLVIERLLDAGLAVIAVHPNQIKASRPQYSIAGGTLAADAGQCPVVVQSGKSQTRPVFAGPATTASATPSTHSRTQAAAITRGRPTSMTAPARGAPATHTPSASSAAPGARSSGASGTTTTPTIPRDTPRDNA
jgi:hypothetical protein